MKRSFSMKTIALPLTIAAGLFIVFSAVNIQGPLSTGDHGRDLYAAERTLHGDVAYQDYWWVYGPLMPFYYAAFMKTCGVSIMSVLLGKAVLKFIAGLFIFLTLVRITSPIPAMLGAIWFYICSQDFFFTYNHMGGTLCITIITAMLMRYITTLRTSCLWIAALTSLVFCFIKINFGLIGLGMTTITAFITGHWHRLEPSPKRSLLYRATLIYFPALVALGYLYFLRGLPLYQIRQCMPYADVDQTYNTLPWTSLASLWNIFIQKFFTSAPDFFFGTIIIIAVIRVLYLAVNQRLSSGEDKRHLLALGILGLYLVFNFHEYIKSGVWYRYLWAQPIEFIMFFTIIALAVRQTGRITRLIVWGIIAILGMTHWQIQTAKNTETRAPGQYLQQQKAKAFVSNHPAWIKTVNDTTALLNKNLGPNETFLALPYDAIYYYLTGRKSPTQLLLFCDQQHIPRTQEERVIADLKKARVNWVVISSRMRSREPGLGTFGVTYSPVLAKYLQENFEPVAQFGDWQNEPGWAWNHGTVVLKRK